MRVRSIVLVLLILVASMPLATPPAIGLITIADHVGTQLDCGDDTGYKLLRFKWGSTPIKVSFGSSIPAQFLTAVKAGVGPWEAEEHPAGDLTVEVPDASDDGVAVSFGPIDGPLGTLAVTSIWYQNRGKLIVRATITFDSAENWEILDPACGIPTENGISIEDVSVHEFGHALPALDHANGNALTMKPFYSGGHERTLATGDKLGIAARFDDGGGGGPGGGKGGGPPCPPKC